MSPETEAEHAEEPAVDEPRAVSWGPTFGPETEADAARPDREQVRGWHPPGGPW